MIPSRRAIVRAPSACLGDGIVTHVERRPVDVDRATHQWMVYVDLLARYGFEPMVLEPLHDAPDAVFVEDPGVIVGDVAVVCRPGADSRRAEVPSVERALECLGLDIARIEPPGTLEGGDVLKVGRRVFVGASGRTNGAGIEQLRKIAGAQRLTVVPVVTMSVLHLKSAVTALPDGTVIGHPPLVDDRSGFETFVPVPEPEGAHVVVLDASTVVMAASAPRSAALLRDRGLIVETVDIGEFEKLEGCVTCLSIRVR